MKPHLSQSSRNGEAIGPVPERSILATAQAIATYPKLRQHGARKLDALLTKPRNPGGPPSLDRRRSPTARRSGGDRAERCRGPRFRLGGGPHNLSDFGPTS